MVFLFIVHFSNIFTIVQLPITSILFFITFFLLKNLLYILSFKAKYGGFFMLKFICLPKPKYDIISWRMVRCNLRLLLQIVMNRNLYHLYLWTWLVLRFCNDLMSRKLIRYGMKFPWPCVLQSIYSFLCLWYSKEKVIGNSFVTQMFRMTSEYAMTLR